MPHQTSLSPFPGHVLLFRFYSHLGSRLHELRRWHLCGGLDAVHVPCGLADGLPRTVDVLPSRNILFGPRDSLCKPRVHRVCQQLVCAPVDALDVHHNAKGGLHPGDVFLPRGLLLCAGGDPVCGRELLGLLAVHLLVDEHVHLDRRRPFVQ